MIIRRCMSWLWARAVGCRLAMLLLSVCQLSLLLIARRTFRLPMGGSVGLTARIFVTN
uniref:Uncharacterized protein n=1 Tax=Ralstonia solanacearum TaxID=305 RepID=A0A0S4X189_RALSL|nr:protein of unknown function [Ralstonia solanacearum]